MGPRKKSIRDEDDNCISEQQEEEQEQEQEQQGHLVNSDGMTDENAEDSPSDGDNSGRGDNDTQTNTLDNEQELENPDSIAREDRPPRRYSDPKRKAGKFCQTCHKPIETRKFCPKCQKKRERARPKPSPNSKSKSKSMTPIAGATTKKKKGKNNNEKKDDIPSRLRGKNILVLRDAEVALKNLAREIERLKNLFEPQDDLTEEIDKDMKNRYEISKSAKRKRTFNKETERKERPKKVRKFSEDHESSSENAEHHRNNYRGRYSSYAPNLDSGNDDDHDDDHDGGNDRYMKSANSRHGIKKTGHDTTFRKSFTFKHVRAGDPLTNPKKRTHASKIALDQHGFNDKTLQDSPNETHNPRSRKKTLNSSKSSTSPTENDRDIIASELDDARPPSKPKKKLRFNLPQDDEEPKTSMKSLHELVPLHRSDRINDYRSPEQNDDDDVEDHDSSSMSYLMPATPLPPPRS